jgi:dihydrofolate reductase
MAHSRISAIAAIGQNRELGKRNDLIWRISGDLKRVRELTTGNTIIMGRKTHESIGRALPNRNNIVVSRNQTFEAPGCTVVDSVDEAIAVGSKNTGEIFIFGGAAIYAEALPLISRLYLTLVADTDAAADTFFPEYSDFTTEISREALEENGLSYTYLILEREVVQ